MLILSSKNIEIPETKIKVNVDYPLSYRGTMKRILLLTFLLAILAPLILFAESTKKQSCLDHNCIHFSLSAKLVLANKDADGCDLGYKKLCIMYNSLKEIGENK